MINSKTKCQDFEWVKEVVTANQIILDDNGNIITSGDEATIAKYSSNGSLIKQTGPSGGKLIKDNQGNFFVMGTYYDSLKIEDTQIVSNGLSDFFIAKFNSDLNLIWLKSYGGEAFNGMSDFDIDENGDLIITGVLNDTIDFDGKILIPSGEDDLLLWKLTSNGTIAWMTQIDDTADKLSPSALIAKNDQKIILTGKGKIGNTSITDPDIFIAEVDKDGNVSWASHFKSTSYINVSTLEKSNAGNYFLAGTFGGNASFGSHNLNSKGQTDIFVAEFDDHGNLQNIFDAGSNYIDGISSLAIDPLENIYITGSFSNTASFGDINVASEGEQDLYIAKLDKQLNVKWLANGGGPYIQFGSSIILDQINGKVWVGGNTQGSATFGDHTIDGSFGGTPILIKVSGGFINGINENILLPDLTIFPNPTQNEIQLNYSANHTITSIKIIDFCGKLIKNVPSNKFEESSLDISDLRPGFYTLNIFFQNEVITRKILKE